MILKLPLKGEEKKDKESHVHALTHIHGFLYLFLIKREYVIWLRQTPHTLFIAECPECSATAKGQKLNQPFKPSHASPLRIRYTYGRA